ncbi:phosphomannomutase/phosphoglucomutase [Candidatus Uhrbacteria bacterium]|nr:phosphomannomutase/phosphoglucomutase [Candidatus Uhrbacteria bacterium]
MAVNPAIFKAYDIRGVVPGEIDEEIAERVGRAMVIHTHATSVLVGRDMRTSSPALAGAVIRGVRAQGAEAIDIGLCSTPMFNFAVASDTVVPPARRSDGSAVAGVMVSASHNPAKYNGFKLDYSDALPVSAVTGMREIRQLVEHGQFPEVARGGARTAPVLDAYLKRVTSIVKPETLEPFRMIVDCGNGMGGHTMPHLAPLIPGEVIPMYWELDGTFPHHEPNPIKPENVRDLATAVRDAKAHIGFAYDGDADRLAVIDERGELVRGDLLTVLLAREILRQHPGATVLYDLRASRVVAEEVRRAGGVPQPTRVGHALIKKHLREAGAMFAGELSNHFYFKDFYGVECTELVMLMVLRVMGVARKPISELVRPLQRYHHSGEINFEVAEKDAVLRGLEERYAKHANGLSRLDGLSFDMGPWWFNVRPSNTEPLLRLVVETPNQHETAARVAEIAAVIQ